MRRFATARPLCADAASGVVVCLLLAVAVPGGPAFAGPPGKAATPAPQAAPASGAPNHLANRQRRLAERYTRLEQVLLRLAELSATNQPRRAALLREAIAQSKQHDVARQFDAATELLEQQQLALAGKRQQQLDTELRQLLHLLLKEESSDRTESEKRKLRHYLKQINRLIKQQRGVKGRTESGENQRSIAEAQGKVGERTGQLADALRRDAAERQAGPAGDDASRPPQDRSQQRQPLRDARQAKKPPGGQREPGPADGRAPDRSAGDPTEGGKAGGSPSSKGNARPGAPEKSPQGKAPSDGKRGDAGDPSSPSADAPAEDSIDSAHRRVDAARKRMRQAEQAIREARRGQAEEQQQHALDALARAKAVLERILRQLREEEIQQMLVRLEARFRKMLEAQRTINAGTVRLDQIPVAKRAHGDEIEAGRLGRLEGELVDAASKALMLLREEGTSVAFPEAVEQMRDEMQYVVERLVRVHVGVVTQEMEDEIVRSLEETIAALRKALRDQDRRRSQSPSSPPAGQPQDPPLVDSLEELRMIRTLQLRVNRRTQRYEKLLQDGSADRADCTEAIRRLADRQQRIRQATYDLQWGKDR